MKNVIILLVAILFSAGMAFAQSNQATVVQNDDGNEAFVEQVGINHTATVTQTSDEGLAKQQGHFANIEQLGLEGIGSGDNNTATVVQDRGWATASHTANIYQWGNDNVADVEQIHPGYNVATITQDGIGNFAGIFQEYWNEFNATQTGDDNTIEGVPGAGIYGFEDVAFQRSVGFSSLGYVMNFTQYGDNNLIQAGQERGTGTSTIIQSGDWNTALSYQNNGVNDVINITQTGYENDAVVTQNR